MVTRVVWLLGLLGGGLCASTVLGQEDVMPPMAGRPEDFSGVVGTYRIAASASPTVLAVEEPLILVVRITGTGPADFVPRRKNLRLFSPEIERNFYVQPLPEQDRFVETAQTWEFVYQLRPKREMVRCIPGLKLVYYSPVRRKYQSTYSPAIPLTVKPPREAAMPAAAVRIQASEPILNLKRGAKVLRRASDPTLAQPLIWLAFLMAGPPALYLWWLRRWRRRHPDRALLARQRRHRATQVALDALSGKSALQVEETTNIMKAFLRQRLEFPGSEPTPAEVRKHLRRLGLPRSLCQRSAEFFAVCDAARFSQSGPRQNNLAQEGIRLINALEAEPSLR
jgi:hypothetical protein